MPTLDEMMTKFGSASNTHSTAATGKVPVSHSAAAGGDATKIASGGETPMKSLFDIYTAVAGQDHEKIASQAAAPAATQDEIDEDFAKIAEQVAEAEAAALVDGEQAGDQDMLKVAAEYDAAGRIMARGFYDEFNKLAAGLTTTAPDNQTTESPSAAKTPALGDRALPTLETNFAGNDAHDEKIDTTGPAPKQNYADSLKPTKTISAGQGTGDDPEAAALSIGSGSPSGFATVRDLSA